MRPYSPEIAAKIEAANVNVVARQPRALAAFRRIWENWYELGQECIACSGGPAAEADVACWETHAIEIDKGLRRIKSSAAAKTYDHEKDHRIHCPSCGELLRTPTACQCLECGIDWHTS
ncbi:MAG: hypothetical protein KDB14_02120 [Planctomycetales bacterium]|nr:hypothetical protein [Planctomycetales bacterium]